MRRSTAAFALFILLMSSCSWRTTCSTRDCGARRRGTAGRGAETGVAGRWAGRAPAICHPQLAGLWWTAAAARRPRPAFSPHPPATPPTCLPRPDRPPPPGAHQLLRAAPRLLLLCAQLAHAALHRSELVPVQRLQAAPLLRALLRRLVQLLRGHGRRVGKMGRGRCGGGFVYRCARNPLVPQQLSSDQGAASRMHFASHA